MDAGDRKKQGGRKEDKSEFGELLQNGSSKTRCLERAGVAQVSPRALAGMDSWLATCAALNFECIAADGKCVHAGAPAPVANEDLLPRFHL
jgi:hypothetical protein